MELLIYNGSQDTIVINDFNKYIHHASTFHFRREEIRVFYWDLLTLSIQDPEDVVVTTIFEPKTRKQITERNKTIVIPPETLFVSDVFMLHTPFVVYPKGYYKLCLYYEKTNQCIAEIIIKNE